MATREYARCLYNMLHFERLQPNDPETIEAWKELGLRVDKFFEVVPRSHLYASRKTHRLLGEVSRRGNILATVIGAEDTPRPNTEHLEAFDQLRTLMQQTAMELTHDLRAHLGIEDLRGPVWYRAWTRIRSGRAPRDPLDQISGTDQPPGA